MKQLDYLSKTILDYDKKNTDYSNFLFSIIGKFPPNEIEAKLKLAEEQGKRLYVKAEISKEVHVLRLLLKDWD